MIEMDGGCRAFGLREGVPFRRGGTSVWRHVGRETGARAISLSALAIAPGASVAWRNGSSDEALYVVEGEGLVRVGGERFAVGPRTGIYVKPGDVVTFQNSGSRPLTLLESSCPDSGPKLRFEESVADTAAPRSPSPIVRYDDQPEERAGDGRWFRLLVDEKAGCAEVTQFVGFIPPGRAPDHFHEYEEVVCILEGEGRFWSGTSSAPIAPGTCLYLPRRQPHCVENLGAAPLSLYGLFYPAGSPAVRFNPAGISVR